MSFRGSFYYCMLFQHWTYFWQVILRKLSFCVTVKTIMLAHLWSEGSECLERTCTLQLCLLQQLTVLLDCRRNYRSDVGSLYPKHRVHLLLLCITAVSTLSVSMKVFEFSLPRGHTSNAERAVNGRSSILPFVTVSYSRFFCLAVNDLLLFSQQFPSSHWVS